MDFQRVGPAGEHRRTVVAHGFGAGLASRASRSTLAFRVEEIRTGHAAAGRVQLPIPHVGIRPGKAPGIGHGVAHLRHSPSSTVTNEASIGAHLLARPGRIRIDIDAAVIMTLGPFGERIKSGFVIFGDQFRTLRTLQTPFVRSMLERAGRPGRTFATSAEAINRGRVIGEGTRRMRSVITIAHQRSDLSYIERHFNYTPSKVVDRSSFRLLAFSVLPTSSPNGCHPMVGGRLAPFRHRAARCVVRAGWYAPRSPRVESTSEQILERRLT